jgi:photosystem II stability/assembly factor-like uncharacterized protein
MKKLSIFFSSCRILTTVFLIIYVSSCDREDPPLTPAQIESKFFNSILDSINMAKILKSVAELSGQKKFQINGKTDTILTRYTNSPKFYKVENYAQSRFEEMGYTVDRFQFKNKIVVRDIQFAPKQSLTGWMLSEGNVSGTVDGGVTWSTQYSGSARLRSLFCINTSLAWAVGEQGAIVKTTDGLTWHTQQSPADEVLSKVFFLTRDLGWACGGNGIILKTQDGGINWTVQNSPTEVYLSDIHFVNERDGWAVGNSGSMLHSSDGGETWFNQHSENTQAMNGVYFLTATHGFAIGYLGTVLQTTDGGSSWTQVPSINNKNEPYMDIDFVDQNNGIIVADVSFLRTTDGGITWSAPQAIETFDIGFKYFIEMVNSNTFWVGGLNGVESSTDAGLTWNASETVPRIEANNLYVTKKGLTFPDKYYVVCAHYDAISKSSLERAPGADDDGTGTATVLEAARILASYDFRYSIRFMLFAGEEQGLVGSRAYAEFASNKGEQIEGVIAIDMIGYDGNNDGVMGINGDQVAGSVKIKSLMESKIELWKLSLSPTYLKGGGSDHKSFWEQGYPAVLLSEDNPYGNPNIHSTTDTYSTLNEVFFRANAKLAIGSLAALAQPILPQR